MGLGIVSLSTSQKRRASGGAPTVTAANEGVSLEGTTVVLGQQVGAAGDPATLTRNAVIPDPGAFSISLQELADASETILMPGDIVLTDGLTGAPRITFNPVSPGDITSNSIVNLGADIEFHDSTDIATFTADTQTGDLFINGGYTSGNTVNFSTGPGKWKLGKGHNGAVTIEPNQYVEVEIDGILFKLAVVSPVG
jgi:hypothetical protein